MFDLFKQSLHTWTKNTDRHSKLQVVYLCAAVVILVAAGLVSLLHYRLGQSLLFIASAAFLAFITNAIVWSLAESFVFSKLGKKLSKK